MKKAILYNTFVLVIFICSPVRGEDMLLDKTFPASSNQVPWSFSFTAPTDGRFLIRMDNPDASADGVITFRNVTRGFNYNDELFYGTTNDPLYDLSVPSRIKITQGRDISWYALPVQSSWGSCTYQATYLCTGIGTQNTGSNRIQVWYEHQLLTKPAQPPLLSLVSPPLQHNSISATFNAGTTGGTLLLDFVQNGQPSGGCHCLYLDGRGVERNNVGGAADGRLMGIYLAMAVSPGTHTVMLKHEDDYWGDNQGVRQTDLYFISQPLSLPPPTTKQSIHVVVKDQKGDTIEKFHYDKTAPHFLDLDWSKEIYVRDRDESPYPNYTRLRDGNMSCEPHHYDPCVPEILVEILQGGRRIKWGYYDEQTTYDVPSPGQYIVRCSTTIQVDGIVVEESTGQPIQAIPPDPTLSEGVDERGPYEYYLVSRFIMWSNQTYGIDEWAYRYLKRYTYQLLNETVTHVDAGEHDWASVCLLTDPDKLGKLAAGQRREIKPPNPGSDVNNSMVAGTMGQVLGQFFEAAPMSGKSLLASEVATVIVLTVTDPDEELKVDELAKAGLTWAAGEMICLKLGMTTGPEGFVVGVAIDTLIELPAWIEWCDLQNDFSRACVDDLTKVRTPEGSTYHVSVHNKGMPLHDVQLGTMSPSLWMAVCEGHREPSYGIPQPLNTGETCEFGFVPPNWFIDTFTFQDPAVIAKTTLIAGEKKVSGEIEFACRYDDIEPEDVHFGMNLTLQSHCDMHVYDQFGRHLGVNYATRQVEEDIPRAAFRILDGDGNEVPYDGNTPDEGFNQTINLPIWATGIYRIELIGTSNGPFHLMVNGIQDGNEVTNNIYEGEIIAGEHLATIISAFPTESNLSLSYESLTTVPIANAGNSQTVYAWIDGIAEVNLDGSGSYDEDDDPLTYKWSWTIDGNIYDANSVNPTIELPVGQHIISLIVNDGTVDSEADEVVITVVPAAAAKMKFTPQAVNCKSNGNEVKAHFVLPKGISAGDVDTDKGATIEPMGVKSKGMSVLGSERSLVEVMVDFGRSAFCGSAVNNGQIEVTVVGSLKSGQYFYGSDKVKVIK